MKGDCGKRGGGNRRTKKESVLPILRGKACSQQKSGFALSQGGPEPTLVGERFVLKREEEVYLSREKWWKACFKGLGRKSFGVFFHRQEKKREVQ